MNDGPAETTLDITHASHPRASPRSMSTFQLEKVEVALTPQQRFEEFLQSRGKRMTQQRRQIVEEVFSRHEHFNADELCDLLARSATPKVSRPTVYRTLNELEEAGLLRKMVLAGRAVYEHDYGYPQHDHLYCEKCEKLIEFHSDEVARIRDAVAREHHFRASSHRLIISGLCAECFRAKRRPRRLELV
jgi:Fur family ferric uptake transcriptional regulator